MTIYTFTDYDDDAYGEYLHWGGGPRNHVPVHFKPVPASQPWFQPTPQDHSVHGGKVSTLLQTDGKTERDELRWRVLPSEAPKDQTTNYDTMRNGPWHP